MLGVQDLLLVSLYKGLSRRDRVLETCLAFGVVHLTLAHSKSSLQHAALKSPHDKLRRPARQRTSPSASSRI